MANSTIANLNVKLLANISGFTSSMASATKPLVGFAGSVVSTSAKIGGLVSAITGLVGAGSLAVLVHQSMEAIDVNAKLSDRLGIATDKLVGLQYAGDLAGVSAEDLTTSFEKLLKNLAEAATKGGPAREALSAIGLDAKTLANESPDQAFKEIADGLVSIHNPAQRAQVAMALFGKSGQSLEPLLMSGAQGIAAAQAEAEKLGLTYDRVSAAKIEAANDSWTRVKAVITGVGNQLAIGLAPYLDAVETKLVSVATTGGGIGPKVGGAVEWVAKAIATAADYAELLPMAFYGFRAAALQSMAETLNAVDILGGGIVKLINLLPGVQVEWTDTFQNLSTGLAVEAADAAQKFDDALGTFNRGDNAAAVTKVFADIRASSQSAAEGIAANAATMGGAFKDIQDNSENLKKVGDTLADLDKQVRQFGMTDGQKRLDNLKTLGATPDQLAQAQKSANQLDSLNAAKKKHDDLQNSAKSVLDSIATPTEKYDQKITNLNDLLQAGMINWDQYGRAIRVARDELEKGDGKTNAKMEAPELMKSGSAQAARLVYDFTRGSNALSKDDVAKKQLASQQVSEQWLRRIEQNTRSADDTQVVDI
jgi:hypothetical protein